MREIKFRAWDTSKWRWIHQTDRVHISLDGDITYCDTDGPKTNRNDLILVEFTGLKDKNGVEIYEWDVVTSADKLGVIITGPVERHMGMWMVRSKALYSLTVGVGLAHLEVIGNKFENPELLK